MNNRDMNKARANQLLQTLRVGFYKVGNNTVMVPTYYPADYYSDIKIREAGKMSESHKPINTQNIEVCNISTVDAVIKEFRRLQDLDKEDDKIGVLNFASAKHPGGGFVTGAMAQEEALCHASTLYNQIKDSKMYTYNQAMCSSTLYNDSMNVCNSYFIKNGRGDFVFPVPATVVTSAAVNRRGLKSFEHKFVEYTMKRRMEEVMQMFIRYRCKILVLGAFGCGVFGNDPKFVAETWRDLLIRYGGYFDKVVFAVLDNKGDNIKAFKDTFYYS